jgi:hypothetical protein
MSLCRRLLRRDLRLLGFSILRLVVRPLGPVTNAASGKMEALVYPL